MQLNSRRLERHPSPWSRSPLKHSSKCSQLKSSRTNVSFYVTGLIKGGVHTSFILDEVNGGDGSVIDIEMGDHLKVGDASKYCVSIPQVPEVCFVKNVDELGFEGEVGVLYLAEDAKLFFVLPNLFGHYHRSSCDVLREGA